MKKYSRKILLSICLFCLILDAATCKAEARYDLRTQVADKIEIEIIKNVTVTLNPNGGSMPETAESGWGAAEGGWSKRYAYENGALYGALPSPAQRAGYAFQGWYTDAAGGDPVTGETALLPNDVTLYAHWIEQETYDVTLDASGGTFDDGAATRTKAYALEAGEAYGDFLDTIPTRAGYLFLGWYSDPLPAGYTLLGSLESTGIQAVDTGVKACEAYGFEFSFVPETNKATFQAYLSSVYGQFSLSQQTDITSLALCRDKQNSPVLTLSTTDYNVIRMRAGHYTFNGTDMGEVDTTTTPLCSADTSDIYVFATSTMNHYSHMRFQYLRLYDQSDNLICNLIPCCKTVGVRNICGLYDTVAMQFHPDADTAGFRADDVAASTQITSATTITQTSDVTCYAKWMPAYVSLTLDAAGGTFDGSTTGLTQTVPVLSTYGDLPVPTREGYIFAGWTGRRLPDGYTEVNYLESTGTQWIDTGVKPSETYGYEMLMKPTSLHTAYQSYLAATYNTGFVLGAVNLLAKCYSKNPTVANFYLNDTEYNEFSAMNGVFVLNEVVKKTYSGSSPLCSTDNNDIYIYNNALQSKPACMQLKYLKLYGSGGALLRNMIPCYSEAAAAYGLYDTVGSAFYGNAGSGTFLAGEVITYDTPAQTDLITQTDGDTLYATWVPIGE